MFIAEWILHPEVLSIRQRLPDSQKTDKMIVKKISSFRGYKNYRCQYSGMQLPIGMQLPSILEP